MCILYLAVIVMIFGKFVSSHKDAQVCCFIIIVLGLIYFLFQGGAHSISYHPPASGMGCCFLFSYEAIVVLED